MNKNLTRYIPHGFIAAGIINIGGVLLFSRAFTNQAINQADPAVMSNFGLLMIIIWGLAYISVAKSVAQNSSQVRWLAGVFAIEKLIYAAAWGWWISHNSLTALYDKDLFAGVFYTIYGINDLFFMIFFAWVWINTASTANTKNDNGVN